MNIKERESKVITKLIQDTRTRKIMWQKHANFILKNENKIISMANLTSFPKDGVYTASFKNRIFQIYINNTDNSIMLELSKENSDNIDFQFQHTNALVDLYNAVEHQDSGLSFFFTDFLMS